MLTRVDRANLEVQETGVNVCVGLGYVVGLYPSLHHQESARTCDDLVKSCPAKFTNSDYCHLHFFFSVNAKYLNIQIFSNIFTQIYSFQNIFSHFLLAEYIRTFIRIIFSLLNIFGYSFGLFSVTQIYSNVCLDYFELPKYIYWLLAKSATGVR